MLATPKRQSALLEACATTALDESLAGARDQEAYLARHAVRLNGGKPGLLRLAKLTTLAATCAES